MIGKVSCLILLEDLRGSSTEIIFHLISFLIVIGKIVLLRSKRRLYSEDILEIILLAKNWLLIASCWTTKFERQENRRHFSWWLTWASCWGRGTTPQGRAWYDHCHPSCCLQVIFAIRRSLPASVTQYHNILWNIKKLYCYRTDLAWTPTWHWAELRALAVKNVSSGQTMQGQHAGQLSFFSLNPTQHLTVEMENISIHSNKSNTDHDSRFEDYFLYLLETFNFFHFNWVKFLFPENL